MKSKECLALKRDSILILNSTKFILREMIDHKQNLKDKIRDQEVDLIIKMTIVKAILVCKSIPNWEILDLDPWTIVLNITISLSLKY